MNSGRSLLSAGVAGACYVFAQIFLSYIMYVYQFIGSRNGRLILLDTALIVSSMLYILHVRGYLYISSQRNNKLLFNTTYALIIGYFIYATGTILLITVHPSELTGILAQVQGALVLIYVLCALSFAFALIRMSSQIGHIALFSLLIAVSPIFFFGGSWYALLFPLPSIFLFIRRSTKV